MDLFLLHCLAAFLLPLIQFQSIAEGQEIGVNYGMQGNDLPPPSQVINLCKSKNITRLRLFNPNPVALKALQNSGIEVVLGTDNMDLMNLANGQSNAAKWVQNNIKPYVPGVKFRYIAAGNEVIPGGLAANVLPAMQNLKAALQAANLSIPVTTSLFLTVLDKSYPPSISKFSEEAGPIMVPIVKFLEENSYPLLCNVYPSFAYSADPKAIRLDYALFNTTDVVVKDGKFEYTNIFDAMVDAVYWALKQAGAPNVEVVVSETGWPSGGGDGNLASIENAKTYNNNLIAHVKSRKGTPVKPNKEIEAYVFALFNENLKPAGVEQHWGLFYPSMTEVYPVNFNP